ncbi:MAG: SAM-dependent methyltransferase [Pseudonocardiaceae bacterium]
MVYVDHDPLVLVHARALLTSTAQGSIDYLDAELGEPEKIVAHAARTLDFTRPVTLVVQTLHHQLDDDSAHTILTRLLDPCPRAVICCWSIPRPSGTPRRCGPPPTCGTPTPPRRSPPASHQLTRFFDRLALR